MTIAFICVGVAVAIFVAAVGWPPIDPA